MLEKKEVMPGPDGPRNILFLALPNTHVEAHNAVLVSQSQDRDVSIDVVLALDDLLRTLRDVRAVT